MKFLTAFFLIFSQLAFSGSLYQCKDNNGNMAYQDSPCTREAVKVSKSKDNFDNNQFKNEFIKTLAQMTGKSVSELKNDPKARQVAEALAVTDAAKSYAFTKIYGVSAKFCEGKVKNDLENYQKKAADIIALGRYYYTNGIHIDIEGKNLSKTGQELTEGLNGMLRKLEREHAEANSGELKKKCKEASRALTSLAMLYSS